MEVTVFNRRSFSCNAREEFFPVPKFPGPPVAGRRVGIVGPRGAVTFEFVYLSPLSLVSLVSTSYMYAYLVTGNSPCGRRGGWSPQPFVPARSRLSPSFRLRICRVPDWGVPPSMRGCSDRAHSQSLWAVRPGGACVGPVPLHGCLHMLGVDDDGLCVSEMV